MSVQEASTKDPKSKMVEVATQLFIKNGVKNVTVHEIAKVSGISKKTVYHYFDSKASLVSFCVREVLQSKANEMHQVSNLKLNPIEEMLELGKQNILTFKLFSKNTLKDLRKYYPVAWDIIDDFKETEIYLQLLQNLKNGMEQGCYRPNMQAEIVAQIYIELLDSAMMQHSYLKTEISLDEVYKECLLMHIYSICSEKGRSNLEELLKNF